MKDIVYSFLNQRSPKLCAFATSSKNGKTELSVMGYAIKDDLSIILSTHDTSRKVKQLIENPHASFVVGWDFSEKNVQIDGTANVITEGDHYQKTEEFFFTHNPAAKKFKDSSTVFIHFTPTWIRLTDTTVSPPHIEEMNLT